MKMTERTSLSVLRRQIGRWLLSATLVASLGATRPLAQHGHGSEGVGTAHMETSCAPAVQARFDRALALLHNFWYARALTQFQEIQKADPECAMAYWGAAMTYNHPLWDEPSREDEAAAWAYVLKGLMARSQNDREHTYLLAVAALYKDAGAGTKQSRDEAYREQMAAAHAIYPDDETKLFHSLNYLSYNYLQLGRYKDAKKAVDLFAAQYAAIANRKTARDSQDLQARHLRGRTIFALPDRVLYGYFDTLARFIVESESWSDVPTVPLIAPSSDFVVMKLHLEAMVAAKRKDVAMAKSKAAAMMERARVPGQHPFVQQILTMQAREAAALAAHAAGDAAGVVTEMEAAVAIEDAIDSLSQPPYPIIPAHELYGSMLMDMGRPAEARKHFEETLRRTPGRPKVIVGIARAAEVMGDTATARAQYTRLMEMWKSADHDRPELQAARRFLQSAGR